MFLNARRASHPAPIRTFVHVPNVLHEVCRLRSFHLIFLIGITGAPESIEIYEATNGEEKGGVSTQPPTLTPDPKLNPAISISSVRFSFLHQLSNRQFKVVAVVRANSLTGTTISADAPLPYFVYVVLLVSLARCT